MLNVALKIKKKMRVADGWINALRLSEVLLCMNNVGVG